MGGKLWTRLMRKRRKKGETLACGHLARKRAGDQSATDPKEKFIASLIERLFIKRSGRAKWKSADLLGQSCRLYSSVTPGAKYLKAGICGLKTGTVPLCTA